MNGGFRTSQIPSSFSSELQDEDDGSSQFSSWGHAHAYSFHTAQMLPVLLLHSWYYAGHWRYYTQWWHTAVYDTDSGLWA